MAGSYNHVVEDDGSLSSNRRVAGMLENGGDVFEAVEEMYGMIWLLAQIIEEEERSTAGEFNAESQARSKEYWVEWARQNYKEGLKISPTKRYKEDNDG